MSVLYRCSNPDEVVDRAKDIFQDVLLRLYGQLRGSDMQTKTDAAIIKVTALIADGKWSEAAYFARDEFAPDFLEMAIAEDDFDIHKKGALVVGTFHFYGVLFEEVGL